MSESAEDFTRCTSCGANLRAGAKFCGECGAKASARCPECGTQCTSTAKFCSECGSRLGIARSPGNERPSVQAPAGTTVDLPGERAQLTVMFCDLVGSTVIAEQLDPEDLHSVISAYHEVCAKVIRRYEGHIAKYLGDGLLVYFGYPQAHEDDALRAVRTGLGLVEGVERLAERMSAEHGVRLATRVGIHTGIVVVGQVGAEGHRSVDIVGEAPNIAARLQEQARPNTVVISSATQRLIQGRFDCQERGTLELKGVTRPLEVYWVQHESTARTRLEAALTSGSLTPMVGRESELNLLTERWQRTVDGESQVVLLGGEAGLGKSRLLHMLREYVAQDPTSWLTELYCSSYHSNTALYPVIDFMERTALRFERSETARERLTKIEALLMQYGLPLKETAPLFASLLSVPFEQHYAPLSISPERQRQKLLEAWHEILKRISEHQPVLFIVEDLHWVDPTTLDLLSLIVEQAASTRVMALFTFRPMFEAPWPESDRVARLNLERLPRSDTEAMISRIASGKSLPKEVVEQIIRKTDGVPLFVEELTKMVLESGLLREQEDAYVLDGPLPALAIPSTLHDSLVARLDRMSTVRDVAQWAAVIGRDFSQELLAAVLPHDPVALNRDLSQLLAAEIIYVQETPDRGRTYRFKHALIQDAAYESLLKSRRQQYHMRVASTLEMRFPHLVETQPELVGHHYSEAGLAERAVPYWQKAGERALVRSAHQETIGHLTRGLEMLGTLPESADRHRRETALRILLGAPLTATRGYGVPEVEETYTRARDLAKAWGGSDELFQAQYGLWRLHMLRANYDTARKQGEELLQLADGAGSPSFQVAAHRAMGGTLFYMGELVKSSQHSQDVIESTSGAEFGPNTLIQDVYDVVDPRVTCRSYYAWNLWLSGFPEKAQAESDRAIDLARKLEHPFSLALAFSFAAWLRQFQRDADGVLEAALASRAISAEQGFLFWLGWSRILEGWAQGRKGDLAGGIAAIRQGMQEWRTQGSELGSSYFLSLLADLCIEAGNLAEAEQALCEARLFAETRSELCWFPELLRMEGDLALSGKRKNTKTAESRYREAVATARERGFLSLELRAASSLARLLQDCGRIDEARLALSPVFDRFGEGRDTEDLKAAAALLAGMA